jgi:RHS repeat-associated protein
VPGSFVDDAFGRRQRKTIDGTITDFVYDGLNPVRQAVGASTVDLLTGLGIDEYFTRADSSSSRDLLSDALGSTVSLSDSSGTIQTEYSYEPFGAATTSGSTSANELRYTGREEDGTGLNYYRARYYHPGVQRFISEDPIGLNGGINPYAYAWGNPLRFRDPLGLRPLSACEKNALSTYFPQNDLNTVDLHEAFPVVVVCRARQIRGHHLARQHLFPRGRVQWRYAPWLGTPGS